MPAGKSKISSVQELNEVVANFRKSRIILTAYELELFTALGERGGTSNQVARLLRLDERAVDRLLNALCALGLVDKKDGVFSNTALSGRYLVRGQPDYLAGLMHSVHLWEAWSGLTRAVRDGGPVAGLSADENGEGWTEACISAMHERAAGQLETLMTLLDPAEGSRLLDVGGGSGAFAMAFVKARAGSTAVVFDLPHVVAMAARYIEREGLSNRVTTVAGNYLTDEPGSGFGLILLSSIVHINSSQENRELIGRCARALNPDGRLVVKDFIMDEERTHPVAGALFALNMLVRTRSGDTYTESEVRGWMEEAGLTRVVRRDSPSDWSLIVGRKS